MSTIIRGIMVQASFRPLYPEAYMAKDAISQPHAIYMVEYKPTVDLIPEYQVAAADEVWNRFSVDGCTLLGVEAKPDMVKIHITGSPFVWWLALLAVPTILGGIGVVLAWFRINQAGSAIPQWAWAGLILAGTAALAVYAGSKIFPKRRVEPEW